MAFINMANSLKKEVRKAIGPSSIMIWQPVAFITLFLCVHFFCAHKIETAQ